ncbi:MAG: preprotein translocase subunit SecG [Caldilineales bacterium]
METIIFIVQIILGILLIALIMMQAKNLGTGSLFGASDTLTTTRRGFDRTLFNLTVAVSVLFFLVAIISAVVVS